MKLTHKLTCSLLAAAVGLMTVAQPAFAGALLGHTYISGTAGYSFGSGINNIPIEGRGNINVLPFMDITTFANHRVDTDAKFNVTNWYTAGIGTTFFVPVVPTIAKAFVRPSLIFTRATEDGIRRFSDAGLSFEGGIETRFGCKFWNTITAQYTLVEGDGNFIAGTELGAWIFGPLGGTLGFNHDVDFKIATFRGGLVVRLL